jgi:hypothetical protein
MSEKLLSKMRALLKMSRDATNEHEAATAMRQLHALLAKHNIEMADIDGPEADESVDEDFFESYTRPWQKTIMSSISRLYFCRIYFKGGRKAKVMVVGTAINRHFALHMIQNIIDTINKQSSREASARHPKGSQWSTFQTSFLNSAAWAIYQRCDDLIEASKMGTLEDNEGNTMPVLASVYEKHGLMCEEYLDKLQLRTGRKTKLGMKSSEGAAAGKAAGNKVQLTQAAQLRPVQKQLT